MGIGCVCWVVLSSAIAQQGTYRSPVIITPNPISTLDPHGAGSWPLSEKLCSFTSGEELVISTVGGVRLTFSRTQDPAGC